MTQHTPGPWATGERSPNVRGLPFYVTRDTDEDFAIDDLIADVATPSDARLIAAAPELLEACREAIKALDMAVFASRLQQSMGDSAYKDLSEAMAKATGEQS